MAIQKDPKFGSSNTGPYEPCFIPIHNSTAEVTTRYGAADDVNWFSDQQIDEAVKKASRHPLSKRFHELLAEAGEMHDKKQADYGLDHDPFHNVRASADFGVPGWVGCMVRADDKMKRLKKYATKGELRNESVRDSFMDLAVYALIGLVLYEEEQ